IPEIDLAILLEKESSIYARTEIVEKLKEAFEAFGVFYVRFPGFTEEYASVQVQRAKEFFDLPERIKRTLPAASGGFTRGYIGMGEESGSGRLEVKEAFSYGYPWDPHTPPENPLQGANIWPAETDLPLTWRKFMVSLFHQMVKVAETISEGLSEALGEEKEFLPSICRNGNTISLMRLFHYFPYKDHLASDVCSDAAVGSSCSLENEKIGSSPHTDWGFLTCIMQDSVGGLQIQVDGQWFDVPHRPHTLVVNAGDYLALLSGGRFRSPVHRVVMSDDSPERFSFVFFYYPSYDATINFQVNDDAGEKQLPTSKNNDCSMEDDVTGKKVSGGTSSHNTLLDIKDQFDLSKTSFGDYLQKWKGVHK
ncbi:unnamed protein product, partial [Heterosigma akashiwo]